MRPLGPIVRLQVQTAGLKVGQKPRQRYDPAPLTAVPELLLDGRGAVGRTARGEELADVHHPDHPASRHRGGNGLSVCFTGHYAAMRERHGTHLADGIAGENILVAAEVLLGEEDLTGGLTVETRDGQCIRLASVVVATPCVEFARYALRFPDDARPDRTVTEALAFLDDGMRGYYVGYAGPPVVLSLGDRVSLEDPASGA